MKKKILCKNFILETTINVCFFNHCFTEWSVARSALEPPEELNHNGRSESQQPDEMQTLPMTPAAAALPAQVNHVKYYEKQRLMWRISNISFPALVHSNTEAQEINEQMSCTHHYVPCTCLQVRPMQQQQQQPPPMVGVGSLQPPIFPASIGMPLPSFPPGVPPPPFLRPGFNPMQMPPGNK